MKTEKRANSQGCKVERRTVDGTERLSIGGYAAVYYREGDKNTEFDFGYGVERIARGAFDAAVAAGQDVRALWNHDTGRILGRTKSGTLKLSVDDVGLRYDVDLADTPESRGYAASIERGDVDGSSFAFSVKRNADGSFMETWEKKDPKAKPVRMISGVDLFDVSPVTFPAYAGASVGIRSVDGTAELEETAKNLAENASKDNENEAKRASEYLEFDVKMAIVSPVFISEDV